jgi:hypothetical protein
MATLAKSQHTASDGHVQRFEKKLRQVKQAVANLPSDGFHEQLIGIIHRPGWTTIAEGMFFETILDSILAQAQNLEQLHQQLMKAAGAVGGE